MPLYVPAIIPHPGFVSGRWYIPAGKTVGSVGAAPGSGSIRLAHGYLLRAVTISTLGTRVTTLFSGGKVSAAIYAADPTTHLFTGNPLASTGDMSTTSAAAVNATLSSGGNVTLQPGLYWWATNCDNATAVMAAWAASGCDAAAQIGATSQGGVIGGSASQLQGFSVAQAYGTWPDLTSASSAGVTASSVPLVQFLVA